jgi:urease beta subunit
VIPGEYVLSEQPVLCNDGREVIETEVTNTGDRPIQVGSHFHFFEVNRALDFDRSATLGMRLDVPAGQSIRFEAGDEREVDLVEFGGLGRVIGFNNLVDGGRLDQQSVQRALDKAARLGFTGMHDRAAGSQS